MSRKEILLKTAIELFNEQGYHATGIDLIIQKSGVAKKTLYTHFKSKDDLILAALRRYDEEFRAWFVSEIEKKSQTPEGKLLAVFDVAQSWFDKHQFNGCMFINAAGEFADEECAIRTLCREFKRLVRMYIESLVKELGVQEPKSLASQLSILLEGAIVTAQVSSSSDAASEAKKAATILISHSQN